MLTREAAKAGESILLLPPPLPVTVPEILEELQTQYDSDDWMLGAPCAQIDPELFFADSGPYTGSKKNNIEKICSRCPVIGKCILDAVMVPDDIDDVVIRGATTTQQRRRWHGLPPKVRIHQVATHIAELRARPHKRNHTTKSEEEPSDFSKRVREHLVSETTLQPKDEKLLAAVRNVIGGAKVRDTSSDYRIPAEELRLAVNFMQKFMDSMPLAVRIRLLDKDPVLCLPRTNPLETKAVHHMLGLDERDIRQVLSADQALAVIRAIDGGGCTVNSQAQLYHVSKEVIDAEMRRFRAVSADYDDATKRMVLNIPSDEDFLELSSIDPAYIRATYYFLGLKSQGQSNKLGRYQWLSVFRQYKSQPGLPLERFAEVHGVNNTAVALRMEVIHTKFKQLPVPVQNRILQPSPQEPIHELQPVTSCPTDAACQLLGINPYSKRSNISSDTKLTIFVRHQRGEPKKMLAEEYELGYTNLVTVLNAMKNKFDALSEAEQAAILQAV